MSTKIREIVTAFTLGFVLTVIATGILIAIAGSVLAQDSVRTYPARLGEQDRRLVTEQPRPEQANQYTVAVAEEDIAQTASSRMACRQQNLYLHYMLVDLAKNLALHPEFAEIYRPAIVSIHDAWCRQ